MAGPHLPPPLSLWDKGHWGGLEGSAVPAHFGQLLAGTIHMQCPAESSSCSSQRKVPFSRARAGGRRAALLLHLQLQMPATPADVPAVGP